MDQLLLYFSTDGYEILTGSRLDCPLSSIWIRYCIIHVTESYWKRLFDRNTLYSPIIHRIHGYYYCSLFLLLFTVYTITVTVTATASSQYSSNMILIDFN